MQKSHPVTLERHRRFRSAPRRQQQQRNAAHRPAVDHLLSLPIVVYPTAPLLRRAGQLHTDVTSCDALCIALAEVLDCALLTADKRLAKTPGTHCQIQLI